MKENIPSKQTKFLLSTYCKTLLTGSSSSAQPPGSLENDTATERRKADKNLSPSRLPKLLNAKTGDVPYFSKRQGDGAD